MRDASSHHFMSCWKLLNFSVFLAASSPLMRPCDDLGRRRLDLAGVDLAGGPVDRHPVAFLERLPLDGHRACLVVHFHGGRAAHADLPHLPCDERGVRRHTAAGRENAFGRDHAAQILG